MLIPTRSRSSRLTTVVAWSLAIALIWPPAEAEGQLMGRIKKAAAAAASGRVTDRILGEPDTAAANAASSSGAATAPARAGSPEFSEDVLEITPAQLTQLVAGLDAIREARPGIEAAHRSRLVAYEEAERTYPARHAAYEKAYREWSARDEARAACADSVVARHEASGARERAMATSDSLGTEMDDYMNEARMKRIESLGARVEEAQKRNDQALLRILADSMQREMQGVTAIAAKSNTMAQGQTAVDAALRAEVEKCGKRVDAPQAPPSPMSLMPQDVANELTSAGAKGAGLTHRQFAVLHERVAAYVLLRGQTGRTSYSYSKQELAVLAGQLDGLRARGDVAPEATWSVGG